MDESAIYRKRLWWVGLFFLAIILVIGIAIFLSLRGRGANLDVKVVPGDATVKIESQTYKPGKTTAPIGVHDVTVSREGFAPITQKVTVTSSLQPLIFALTPQSAEAKKWAADHQKEYSNAELIGGEADQKQADELISRYPLVDKLPFNTSFYQINYSVLDRQKNTIYIRIDSSSAMGRQVALEQIKAWGFQPTDYQIVFPGLRNPLDPKNVEINGE